jgi:OmpA-OmpF porin, OOP family
VLGLGAVALAIVAPLATAPGIERELTKKVEAAATAEGFNVKADFSGQDGTLVCTGPVDESVLAELAQAIKGVRKIDIDDATCNAAPAPEPAPATTIAAAPDPATTPAPVVTEAVAAASQLKASAVVTRGAAGVVLSGVVDTEDQQASLVKAATDAFGAGNVTDKLTVAGIDGAGSDPHVEGLTTLIAGMRDNVVEGEAGFNGTALYINGIYPDAGAQDALDAAIGAAGVEVGNVDLALDTATTPAPAVTFDAESALDADGKITLSGVVPNETARKKLIDAAGVRVGAANVVDKLTLADPAAADDSGVDGLAKMIEAMPPNLYTGAAGWDGTKFYATGQYLSEESKVAFEAVATEVGVATTDLAIEPREAASVDQAAELEKELNDLVALSPIPFDPGKSSLLPEADAILDKVASLAKKYAGVGIAVNGHTDADGSEGGNQTLSDARANQVRDSLIERGVPAEQLTAQGFGESQPIAPNDTPENKAKNRRVVFTVVKQ